MRRLVSAVESPPSNPVPRHPMPTAEAVTFADTLPASLSFVGVTSSSGLCSQSARSVSCAFCDMAVGSQANVVISVQAPAMEQTITNMRLGGYRLIVNDPCQADLIRTPHVVAEAGWVWSRQNPPIDSDVNRPGKWMLFPRCAQAVTAWRIVAQAGYDGQIWQAKISPSATRGSHLICVYTPDFTDQADVETVAQRLDRLGLVERAVYYKPDVFTYAGVYNRSRSANRASVYEYLPAESRMQATPALRHALELLAKAR